MAFSKKYSRTWHYPFSPGATNDDRINYDYWEQILQIKEVVHTEKLDGENTCLSRHGVFARSHAAPTRHPWAGYLRQRWEVIKTELGDLEIFGENLYAIHSIEYRDLEHHFFVFAIREGDRWLSWEEVQFYAGLLDFSTVPEVARTRPDDEEKFVEELLAWVTMPSAFSSVDAHTREPCSMEGVVTRNVEGYAVEAFANNVFKYVRKDHVKTDEHWTRNSKRAPLKWETNA